MEISACQSDLKMKQTKIDELEKRSRSVIAKNQELKQKVCKVSFAYIYEHTYTYLHS